jgi:indolepyruvate ferredoxin oxidoreductase, beta subunit
MMQQANDVSEPSRLAEMLPQGGADATAGIIKLAVLAVGGQGGGVLTNWITDLAERNGYHAQSTSVAGVAQRTGATIYYVEMAPRDSMRPGRKPVFALSPAPGDVDILIAAELAEAGRAILRGFVTPDRTTLIASTHRTLAVSEKMVPGDGRADGAAIATFAGHAAQRLVAFDMERLAVDNGSVISATLFGALAGSSVLPFPRDSFEATIAASGRGVKPSLKAFSAGFARAAAGATDAPNDVPAPVAIAQDNVAGPTALVEQWRRLVMRAQALPSSVQPMALAGLAKVVDFLDIAHGAFYLDEVERALAQDSPDHDHVFTREAAKYLANGLTYDDVIRVADLKTRASRAERVRAEAQVAAGQTLETTEYFHPRMAEICGCLPVRLGRAIEARPGLMRAFDRVVDRGRRIRTDGIAGFSMLWLIAGLKRQRRRLLRHEVEMAHVADWFTLALETRAVDYDLGVEVLRCRRLIKGYSDTHQRGLSKFDRVLSALPQLRMRDDGAAWLRRLREAALLDEKGTALDGALRTVASL